MLAAVALLSPNVANLKSAGHYKDVDYFVAEPYYCVHHIELQLHLIGIHKQRVQTLTFRGNPMNPEMEMIRIGVQHGDELALVPALEPAPEPTPGGTAASAAY